MSTVDIYTIWAGLKEDEDMDGFGVLTCEMCGYCSHPSVTGGRCDSCDRPVPRSAAAPPAAQEGER